LACGEAFLKLQTADFVPDVDGFQGRESVVPADLRTNGPSGPTGPLVGAAAQAAPTAVPLSANAAHRGPNRCESGSAGPVHTRSSRSEQDDSGKPEAKSSTKGPTDDPPLPPAKRGPADEFDDQNESNDGQSDFSRNDVRNAEQSGVENAEPDGVPGRSAPEQAVPVGERAIPVERSEADTFEVAAFASFVRALNERDANGQLAKAAQELRRYYYKRPNVDGDTNQPTGVVQRRPGRLSFPAAGPDGTVVRVPVPPLEYLVETGDFHAIPVPTGPGLGARVQIQRWEGPDGGNAWFDPDLPVVPAEKREERNPNWTQWHSYQGNRVRWLADSPGRGRAAEAVLRKDFGGGERPWADTRERKAAARRGIDKDAGGHVVGWRFFKEVLPANYFPQNTTFNIGAYKTFENEVADWINAGYEVELTVFLSPNQARPDQVTFVYTVVDPANGKVVYAGGRTFGNEPLSGVERFPDERIQSHKPGDENLFESAAGNKTGAESNTPDARPDPTHRDHTDGTNLFARGAPRTNQDVFDNGGGLPRTPETVAEVAAIAGVPIHDVDVVIVNDPEEVRYLDYHAACACTPIELRGEQIRLGPAAFSSRETLAAALRHERTHVEQFRAGAVVDTQINQELEDEARASELDAVERLRAYDRNQVHGRDDVRPQEQGRDPGSGSPADRSDRGRDGPANGRHGPDRPGAGRGAPDARDSGGGKDHGDTAARASGRDTDHQRDGADRSGLNPESETRAADDSQGAAKPQRRAERFLPGFLLVGLEATKAIVRWDVRRAAGMTDVRQTAADRYVVMTQDGQKYRLFLRVMPLADNVDAEFVSVPGETPTAWVTLSDRTATTRIPSLMARILAETSVATLKPSAAQLAGTEEGKTLAPDSNPWMDPRFRNVDHGDLAEVRQLATEHDLGAPGKLRQRRITRLLAEMIGSMGLHKDQPDADVRRALIKPDDQKLAERFQDRRSPKDNRPALKAYVAKAAGTTLWTALLVGAAGYTATGSVGTAIALASPALANGLLGALAERWLDGRKSRFKQGYAADKAERDYQNPGMEGLLDGEQPAPPPPSSDAPRATKQWHYAVRHLSPLTGAAAVAGVLALTGNPTALSTAAVLATTAVARTFTERLIDKRKRDYRRARVHATAMSAIADANSVRNQLLRLLNEQRRRIAELEAALQKQREVGTGPTASDKAAGPVTPSAPDKPGNPDEADGQSPKKPSIWQHLFAQVVDNDAAATARVATAPLPTWDFDPTDLARSLDLTTEAFFAAYGPAIGAGLLGAVGDKIFTDVEETIHAAQKRWDHARRDNVRGQALLDALSEPLRDLDQKLQELARVAAQVAPDLTDRTADRGPLPTPPVSVQGPRPGRLVKFRWYAVQTGLAAAGLAGSVVVLENVIGLSELAWHTGMAAAAAMITAAPVDRMLFRRAELARKDANAEALNRYGVDRDKLGEHSANAQYLFAQMQDQIERLTGLLKSETQLPVTVSPADADYTDRVRAAAELAYGDVQTAPADETARDLDVRRQRVAALERIDRLAAAVDWAEANDPGSTDAADARAQLAHAISLYEAIRSGDGAPMAFPDLATVSPAHARRVTGGPTDQVRAGAARALRRLLREPEGKPLLRARLKALELIVQAANAVDAHAGHAATGEGTAESHDHLRTLLAERIAAYNQLLLEANILGGFPLPAISPAAPPDDGPGTAANPTPSDPLTTPPPPLGATATPVPPPSAGPAVTTVPPPLARAGDSVEIPVTESGVLPSIPPELIVDPEALATLDARWIELVRAGFEVKVGITRVARPTAAADPLRFSVEVTDPRSTDPFEAQDIYPSATAPELVTSMITDQQSAPGRHRQLDVNSDGGRHHAVDDEAEDAATSDVENAASAGKQAGQEARRQKDVDEAAVYVAATWVDPAAGAVSGEVVSSESRNRARWSFGEPGQADRVVLELREVHLAERLPIPGTRKSEALPPLALEWAFARDRARGLIPPGVEISAQEFVALEQRMKELIGAGQEITLVLRAVPGPDGRPELTVAADVRSSAGITSYDARPLAEMVDALGKYRDPQVESEQAADGRSEIARVLNPGPAPANVPEWARGEIPPGVDVSTGELARLDHRIRRLNDAGQEVDVGLRVKPGPDGRPELVVTATVTDPGSGRTKLYRARPVAEMIDALSNHYIRPPADSHQKSGPPGADGTRPRPPSGRI
jgi:hypothetical protein